MQKRTTFVLSLLLSMTAQGLLQPLLFSQEQAIAPIRELSLNRTWGEQAFSDTPTAVVPANRLVLVHESTPGDTKKDRSSTGGPIVLGTKTYSGGLGVSPRSVLRVELTKPAMRFKADIGVDQSNDSMNSSIRFIVEAGGKKSFVSDFMRSSAGARSIDVPLDGAQVFDLIVEAGPDNKGAGVADWADASVFLQDGSQLRLDELADHWEAQTELPFSFTLGGRSSRDFLREWKRDVQVEQIDEKRIRRTVTLQDPNTGLEVRAVATIYTDTPGVDWTLYLSNHGTKDTPILEKLNALDVTVNPGVGTTPVLHRLRGSTAAVDDWQPYEDSLKPEQRIEFAPTNGKSSEGVSPYFTLQYGGGGVITAVGWSGGWSAATEWQKDGKLHLQASLQNLHLRLHPGESIRESANSAVVLVWKRSVSRLQPLPRHDVEPHRAQNRRGHRRSPYRSSEHLVLRSK